MRGSGSRISELDTLSDLGIIALFIRPEQVRRQYQEGVVVNALAQGESAPKITVESRATVWDCNQSSIVLKVVDSALQCATIHVPRVYQDFSLS